MSTLPTQPRQPRGVPAGGEYTARDRTDADVALPSARTIVDGWDLRNLRQSGMGRSGPIWSAVIHRHGVPAVVIASAGDGSGTRLDTLADPAALEDFRASAARIIPGDDGSELAAVLRAAAACDRMVRLDNMAHREAVELLVITGELPVQYRALLG